MGLRVGEQDGHDVEHEDYDAHDGHQCGGRLVPGACAGGQLSRTMAPKKRSGADDQDGDFVFECTMEYYVQIDPLTQQTNYFPYQTFEGMKLLHGAIVVD